MLEQAVDRVTPDDMCHLVRHDERHLVPIPLAQMEEGSRDEDEAAREGKRGRLICSDGCRLEATEPIAYDPR